MFKAAATLAPIDAAVTQAGRWLRVIGAAVHTGLTTLKSLTCGAKPRDVVTRSKPSKATRGLPAPCRVPVDGSAAAPDVGACRAAYIAEIRRRVIEVIDREAADVDHNNALVEALDARLAFNLAYVDIDILPLRERVMRVCADLRLGPDGRHWNADDFSSRGYQTDNPGWSAPRTKEALAEHGPLRAHRPPPPILAAARLE